MNGYFLLWDIISQISSLIILSKTSGYLGDSQRIWLVVVGCLLGDSHSIYSKTYLINSWEWIIWTLDVLTKLKITKKY